MTIERVTPTHLARRALIYVRQSTLEQVTNNLESQRRQYALAERAVELGWQRANVEVIDDDLSVSPRWTVCCAQRWAAGLRWSADVPSSPCTSCAGSSGAAAAMPLRATTWTTSATASAPSTARRTAGRVIHSLTRSRARTQRAPRAVASARSRTARSTSEAAIHAHSAQASVVSG